MQRDMPTMPFPPLPAWTWDVPAFFNIGAACTDRHLGTPIEDRTAMIVVDEAAGDSEITFKALAHDTSRFAEVLRQNGIAYGDRVLIRLPNSLAYPVAFLGSMKRGAVAVPTSTLLTPDEMTYLAKDSGASVIVTDKATWASVREKLVELPNLRLVLLTGKGEYASLGRITALELWSSIKAISGLPAANNTVADDPAYLVYTSGTTGYPKGVLHAHRALIGREPASQYWFNFMPESEGVDRILHSGKFNWTYVLGSGLMDPLYQGKTVIVYEGSNDALTWPRLIHKYNATIFIGVPTVYRQIIQKTEVNRADVPSLRFCMSAGEHLSDEMLGLWRERFGMDIYEAVGMSEFSYYLSQNVHRPIRAGSAGFPQPGHAIKLMNPETLLGVAQGEEGMIAVPLNDPGLFLRYWNLPDETAKYKHDGYFWTGDYARYDQDGYIHFLGRKDDIIKSFGYRVSPVEVERIMKSHDAVADCAVVGEDIETDKRLVVAYIIPHANTVVTPDQLLHFGKERLASYKAPKVVYIARDFPRTKNGKILRRDITPTIAVERSAARA
jgi:acetyl-CoA synthetase